MSGLVFACFVLGGLTPGPLPPVDPPLIPFPPVDPPVDPPVESPVDPPVEPPVDPPMELPVDPPMEPPVDPPMELPVDPPMEPPVDPPMEPPVDPPMELPVDPPMEPPVDPPMEPPVDPPVVPQFTDYCQTSYCAAGLMNVGCNPPPLTGGPRCTEINPVFLGQSPSDINDFLDTLNSIRSLQVSGDYGYLPTARRMPTLQWDEELASQAGHNVRNCQLGNNDSCRNTAKYSNVGQSAIATTSSDPLLSKQGIFQTLSEEVTFYQSFYQRMSCNPLSYDASCSFMEKHMQIINDRSTKVGCAVMSFVDQDITFSNFVCNFSDNVAPGVPVYTAGSLGAGCTKMNPKYPSLCSIDEVF